MCGWVRGGHVEVTWGSRGSHVCCVTRACGQHAKHHHTLAQYSTPHSTFTGHRIAAYASSVLETA
eukprot:2934370-Rhodomonas_salina.1